MTMGNQEYEYVRTVAAAAKIPFDEALARMTTARDEHGVSFREYNKLKLYRFTEKAAITQGERLKKLDESNRRHMEAVCQATGRTEAQIRHDLDAFNDNPYAKVDIAQYDERQLYSEDRDASTQYLMDLHERQTMLPRITAILKAIDRGESTFEVLWQLLPRYYELTESTLLPSDIEDVRESIEKSAPEILEDEDLLRQTVVDMLVCKRTMGFWDFEYLMFDFRNKSFAERRTFVSNYDRTVILSRANDRVKSEVLDNKALTYEIFKDFYGREAAVINGPEDESTFADFCSRHAAFVKKPLNGAMGTGIGKVTVEQGTDLHELFTGIFEDVGPFICEELIIAHPAIRQLNADSVNTVRLSTYFDGHTVHMHWPFMKIGRAGSFVDNGGAGGILVAIDEEKGTFVSTGIDEACTRYTQHPDNGTVFAGFQLPNWNDALELGRRIAMCALERIPDVRFIGWDITCNDQGRWVVIEGNAFSQFIGQQAPLEIGVRTQLDKMIRA